MSMWEVKALASSTSVTGPPISLMPLTFKEVCHSGYDENKAHVYLKISMSNHYHPPILVSL